MPKKMSNKKGTNDFDIFDNPMVRAAEKALTKEDLDRYKRLGESMFKGIDFATSEVDNPMEEALAYIEVGLRSGLHPTFLDENEINLLISSYGDKWYQRFGYTEEDLKTIR